MQSPAFQQLRSQRVENKSGGGERALGVRASRLPGRYWLSVSTSPCKFWNASSSHFIAFGSCTRLVAPGTFACI